MLLIYRRQNEAAIRVLLVRIGNQAVTLSDFDKEIIQNSLSGHLLKTDRHDGLRAGRIVDDRIGIWKSAGVALDEGTRETAALMGY